MTRLKIVALLIGLCGFRGTSAFSLPSDQECSKLMVGAWRSPRHDYLYFADGTWWMGKPDPSVTHGKWHILNGTLFSSYTGQLSTEPETYYTIQSINNKEILYGGYRMIRIPGS